MITPLMTTKPPMLDCPTIIAKAELQHLQQRLQKFVHPQFPLNTAHDIVCVMLAALFKPASGL